MARQVMGIIYAAPEVGNNRAHVQANIPSHCPPLVFLKGNSSSAPITISIDNYLGAYNITDYLIRQDYRHIAHIGGPMAWFEARERKRGWSQALLDAGRWVDDNKWSKGSWNPAQSFLAEKYSTIHRLPKHANATASANVVKKKT